MYPLRACLLLLALTALPSVGGNDPARDTSKKKERDDKKESIDLGDVYAEVTVLQVLHALRASTAQLEEIARLAPKTAQKPPPRKGVRVSATYRKALLALRAALLGGDDDKIEAALTAFDLVGEKETPEFDEIEIGSAARTQAAPLLERLGARQVAGYVAGVADDFPDPVERLVEAMKQARKLHGKEWQALRDDVAYQVGWLVAGLDADLEEKARDRATALLDRAAALGEKAYGEQLPALKKAARELVGKVGPIAVIRHYVQRVLAEVLSNHRLAAAVAALRKARGKGGE